MTSAQQFLWHNLPIWILRVLSLCYRRRPWSKERAGSLGGLMDHSSPRTRLSKELVLCLLHHLAWRCLPWAMTRRLFPSPRQWTTNFCPCAPSARLVGSVSVMVRSGHLVTVVLRFPSSTLRKKSGNYASKTSMRKVNLLLLKIQTQLS